MPTTANQLTKLFYANTGWRKNSLGVSEDTERWEDLRPCSADYVRNCRLRIKSHVPESGNFMLDVGCGPMIDDEYVSFSNGFAKRYCVDFSQPGLERAAQRLGDHGVYIQNDFLDVRLPENHFDCSLSSYSLFHVDERLQAQFVRKMLSHTKPAAPVVVSYSNHDDATTLFPGLPRWLSERMPAWDNYPYYHSHPQKWWQQFADVAEVKLYPLRLLDTLHHKLLIPDGETGRDLLRVLYDMEEAFPDLFVKWCHYYVVVLKKLKP